MWDFDDKGIVVDVIFPANPAGNLTSVLTPTERTYYELQCFTPHGLFIDVRKHEITEDVRYHCKDYLIPTSLAYLARVGTLAEFEKDVEYHYVAAGTLIIKHVKQSEVLRKYLRLRFGQYVYTDNPADMESLIPGTCHKVGEYLNAVLSGSVPVQELKERNNKNRGGLS